MKLFTKRLFLPVLTLSIAVMWFIGVPAYTQQVTNSCRPQVVSTIPATDLSLAKRCTNSKKLAINRSQAFKQLARANVVYLGENHDRVQDHQKQLKIIEELYRRNKKIAIALEMFQRPYQGVIDDYLAGKISEQQLLAKTEYETRWGYPWQYYAPIIQFAKAQKLPVLALNVPTEVTRKVASSGINSLTPEERKHNPPLTEIRTDNAQYRQLMLDIFQQHQADAKSYSPSFERFFFAQVLWDETMAEAIAQFLKTNPSYQVVVLAGQGHIIHNYGIPSRVQRRITRQQFSQSSILLSSPQDEQTNTNTPIADFIWLDSFENNK